ncbi:MAG TPA: DHH family phosphoesterase, partial [Tenacibaculum sp.]|nr:DHH family phosphoesterase [Tenacibaculum sp.]
HSNVNDSNTHSRLLLLGQSLSNLEILPEYKTAFITLSEKEKKKFSHEKGDTEGIVNYALSIKGVVFGVIFIEDEEQGIIKISFRSKGKFSVNQFARNYFDGGGHDNAAGGRSEMNMEDTLKFFKTLLPKYKNDLINSYEI